MFPRRFWCLHVQGFQETDMTIRRCLPGAAFFFLFTTVLAFSQTAKLPDTEAGKLASGWLAQCNSPNRDALIKWNSANREEAFLKEHSAEEAADNQLRECTRQGGFDVVKVNQSAPDHILLTAQGKKSGVFLGLEFGTRNGK